MNSLQLKIISAEKTLFKGSVSLVNLPGTEGSFSILPQHAALISSLGKGHIIYTPSDTKESKTIDIQAGFVEVENNIVTVCVE